jgi:hypothetical protein
MQNEMQVEKPKQENVKTWVRRDGSAADINTEQFRVEHKLLYTERIV